MWAKLLHAVYTHKRNPAYLSCYRIHDNQLTAKNAFDGTYDTAGDYIRKHYSPELRRSE